MDITSGRYVLKLNRFDGAKMPYVSYWSYDDGETEADKVDVSSGETTKHDAYSSSYRNQRESTPHIFTLSPTPSCANVNMNQADPIGFRSDHFEKTKRDGPV